MIPILLLLQAAMSALPTAPPAPPPTPWEVRTRTSADGVVSTSAAAVARDGSSRLLVKCDKATEAVVSVQFFTRQPLQEGAADGSFPSKTVGLRFDNGAANEYAWQFRAAAAFISDDAAVTSLTQQLARAKLVKVETTNPGNYRVEALFDGPASDAPIRQVLAACNYVVGVGPAPQATPTPAQATKPAPALRKGRRK